jgi:hypothetical protein
MTPAAQIRRMLKPLLQRHSDLTFHRQALIFVPVRHLVRKVIIDRTGGPDLRRVVSNVQFLGQPDGQFGGTHAKSIYPPGGNDLWLLSDPQIADKLIAQIEPEVLDELKAVRTLDDYVDYMPTKDIPRRVVHHDDLEHLIVEVARGHLRAAETICEALVRGSSRYAGAYTAEIGAPIIDRLYPLIQARDRAGLARVLREYEELTVKTNKLEDLWEPTPFPLETG